MNPLSVLSKQAWNLLFSEQNQQKAVASKKSVAEFLIALGKPDSEIMQEVKKQPNSLKEVCNLFKLSLLDLAIMKGARAW